MWVLMIVVLAVSPPEIMFWHGSDAHVHPFPTLAACKTEARVQAKKFEAKYPTAPYKAVCKKLEAPVQA